MKIILGSDERSPVVAHIATTLEMKGHEVRRLGTRAWGRAAVRVGEAVAKKEADFGVVCCFTGTGVAMAANKVPGVRAALCVDAPTAKGARKWNDANVLALSLRLLTNTLADEIIEAWLATKYAGTEAESLGVIKELDRARS